jgi:hypothetical protein
MLILGPSNSGLKKLINIQKCPSNTKLDHCALHGRKFNPNPNFLGTAEAYFVCHVGPIFQISLIYAFIGCL